MSLDVAAGVIGVVSLGIQVCQGLLKYYDSWNEYHERTSATRASMADLIKTLQVIDQVMKGSPLAPDVFLRVKQSLDACEGGINRLKTKLDKISKEPVGKSGIKEKVKEHLQKAAYPFREDTLVELKQVVQDLRSNLHLALEVLQM